VPDGDRKKKDRCNKQEVQCRLRIATGGKACRSMAAKVAMPVALAFYRKLEGAP